jgi:hypothetical protein
MDDLSILRQWRSTLHATMTKGANQQLQTQTKMKITHRPDALREKLSKRPTRCIPVTQFSAGCANLRVRRVNERSTSNTPATCCLTTGTMAITGKLPSYSFPFLPLGEGICSETHFERRSCNGAYLRHKSGRPKAIWRTLSAKD